MSTHTEHKFRWESVFLGCLLALWIGNVLRVGFFNPLGMWLYQVWFAPETGSAPIRLTNFIRIALQVPPAFAWVVMSLLGAIVSAGFYYLHFRFATRGENWLRRRQRWIVLTMLLLLVLIGRLSDLALDRRILSLIIPDFLQITATYFLFYAFWGMIETLVRRFENR